MEQRRNKGEGSISKRSDGKWLVQIVIGYDDLGRLRKKSKVCKTKTEAVQVLKHLIIEKAKNNITLQGGMLFKDFLKRWLSTKKSTLRPKSYMDYERIVETAFIPKLGDLKIERIKTNVINDFLQGQLDRGIGHSTVNKYKVLLKALFKMAAHESVIIKNPVEGAIVIKKVKPETSYIKKSDMDKILERAEKISNKVLKQQNYEGGKRYLYPIILTAYHTGMRIGEILALEWEFVDFKNQTIKICRNLSEAKDDSGKIKLIVGAPKTSGSIRTITISGKLSRILREIKLGQVGEYKMVFPIKNGGYISASNFSRLWRALLKDLDLKGKYRFHDIRHTHATEALNYGGNINSISARLGHADVKTTLSIYAHALPKQDKQIAEFFDEDK